MKPYLLTKTCIQTFTAALFTPAEKWKKTNCPSTSEEILKNVAIKRNEVLIHDTAWINFENISTVNEASHILGISLSVKCLEYTNPEKQKAD